MNLNTILLALILLHLTVDRSTTYFLYAIMGVSAGFIAYDIIWYIRQRRRRT